MPRYKNPRKTWAYSTEFKIRAVKLSSDPDYKISDVADGLGIHPFMLSRWRKEYQDGILHGDGKLRIGMTKKKKSPPRKMTELAALKKRVARLEQENDLLKKWQQYLAEVHQKDLGSSTDTKTPSE
jgi:transposase